MNKTRRVELEKLVPHPKYGKLLRRRTICHAHDETNQSHVGDTVEIMETRPLSKTKRWRIVRIVRLGAQQALAGEGEAAKVEAALTSGVSVESGRDGARPTSDDWRISVGSAHPPTTRASTRSACP